MEKKKTGCECPLAGFCKKHNMHKTPHYHKLCKHHQGYFNQWEQCRGPGQDQAECRQNKHKQNSTEIQKTERPKEEMPKEELKLPGVATMAKNFAGSFFKHALTGFGKVDPKTYDDRLTECVNCEFYIPNVGRCSQCGCPCATKASWKSSKCPVGKW